MKAMMADGWDVEDVPASCEVQVEMKFEDWLNVLNVGQMEVNS